jgi:hypothetical protein
MHIGTSLLYFTTHRAVLTALCGVKYEKRGENVHEVQLCVVKYKKEE